MVVVIIINVFDDVIVIFAVFTINLITKTMITIVISAVLINITIINLKPSATIGYSLIFVFLLLRG